MSSSSFSVQGMTALVTGGTSGIGKAIAATLLDGGANVCVGSRSSKKIDAASKELSKGRDGAKLLAVQLDVADAKSFDAALAATVKQFGRIDCLINCAGVNLKKPTVEVKEAEHRELFETNYFGAFHACQQFCRQVMKQNEAACGKASPVDASNRIGQPGFGGCIVNVCSVTSFLALEEVATYGASKGALWALTRQLAVEWPRQYGIRVNAIAPGFVPADQNRHILESSDRGRRILENTPMQRFGTPEEMAGAAVFLCSPAARFVNGECINIDGGYMIHGVSEAKPRNEA